MINSRYRIVLCEIYNEHIHGKREENDDININSHYLIIGKFTNTYDNYYSDSDDNSTLSFNDDNSNFEDDDYYPIEEIMELHTEKYNSIFIRNIVKYAHPFIRNYINIVLQNDYIRPEIAECITLSTGEHIAILKTFWIRIIQRSWKRVLQNKKSILQKRQIPNELFYKQIYGKWSSNCIMPGIVGMLRLMC